MIKRTRVSVPSDARAKHGAKTDIIEPVALLYHWMVWMLRQWVSLVRWDWVLFWIELYMSWCYMHRLVVNNWLMVNWHMVFWIGDVSDRSWMYRYSSVVYR